MRQADPFLGRRGSLVAFAAIILLALGAYAYTFYGEFQFDDQSLIISMARAKAAFEQRGLWAFMGLMYEGGRPVTDLTFFLNYIIGGREVFGYHVVNFIIHVLNGLLVYYLVLLAMGSSRMGEACNRRAGVSALVASSLFVLHPVQTQAVSYITQRYELLFSFFYLLSLACYVIASGRDGTARRALFYAASGFCFFLSLGSKQTALSLPAAILIYDYYFLKPRPFIRRAAFPAALLAVSAVSGALMLMRFATWDKTSVGFGVGGITPWEYLLTQFRAVSLYLRLIVMPIGQNLDYEFLPSRGFMEPATALSFFLLLAIAAVAMLLRRSSRLGSFGVFWFFIVLSPTSSFVPVVDLAVEQRAYMASAGIFALAADMVSWVILAGRPFVSKVAVSATVAVVMVLAMATYFRNDVWTSRLDLWQDVVGKSPNKPRVHYNLANAYKDRGMIEEAAEHYEEAIRLDPGKSNAYNNLANVYALMGRYRDAVDVYRKAIGTDSSNYEAYYNIGVILSETGDRHEAEAYLREFVKIAPDDLTARKKAALRTIEKLKDRPERP